MKIDNNDRSALWTDSVLMARIETFGFQMAEMGRQQAFETTARNSGDYDGAAYYAKNAELYRESAKVLMTDINAQITLRRTDTLVSA